MTDPVILTSVRLRFFCSPPSHTRTLTGGLCWEQGQTYERVAIQAWFRTPISQAPGPAGQGFAGWRLCPTTHIPVPQVLTINFALKQAPPLSQGK